MDKRFATVDEYINSFPEEIKNVLQQVRAVVKETAPDAEETISYNMPAYKQNGILVYFAGYKTHIGFYALPSGHKAFQDELAMYKQGKGSVQFPLKGPMPINLIKQIVKFRLEENLAKKKA